LLVVRRHEQEVLAGGQVRDQVVLLEDDADVLPPEPGGFPRRVQMHLLTVEDHLS
jgi:hypothetical protein